MLCDVDMTLIIRHSCPSWPIVFILTIPDGPLGVLEIGPPIILRGLVKEPAEVAGGGMFIFSRFL